MTDQPVVPPANPPKQIDHPCRNCGVHVVLCPGDTLSQAAWMHIPRGSGFASAYLHCHQEVATP